MPKRLLPHISAVRMAAFRSEWPGCSDEEVAQLYHWQIELCAAWYEVLGHLEMLLRNAVDEGLGAWNANFPAAASTTSVEWLRAPNGDLAALIADTFDRQGKLVRRGLASSTAKDAAQSATQRPNGHPRKGASVNHDDQIAQLTFGNLVWLLPTTTGGRHPQLTGRSLPPPLSEQGNDRKRERLWLDAIGPKFPHARATVPVHFQGRTVRGDLERGYYLGNCAEKLRRLRNRVGHHEQTFSANHAQRHTDALTIVGAIDPAAADALRDMSRVLDILAKRPCL